MSSRISVPRFGVAFVALLIVTSGTAVATSVGPSPFDGGSAAVAEVTTHGESVNETTPNKPDPKLSTDIVELAEEAQSGATDSELITHDEGEPSITVRVEAEDGQADRAAGVIDRHGGEVRLDYGDLLLVELPVAALESLADSPAVSFVRRPVAVKPTATSEGLASINAPPVHDSGYSGDGVSVAVVDVGFNVENPEIADNVVDAVSFAADPIQNGTNQHGTAVAEVLVDTAPNASIALIKVDNEIAFLNAVEYIDAKGYDVASASVGFSIGPFDGTSQLDQEIEANIANGTQWFISSGNEADRAHLNLTWNDPNGNEFLNFTESSEMLRIEPRNTGQPVVVFVNWDDFPASYEDYDALLYDELGNAVDESANVQNGTQPPVEIVMNASPKGDLFLAIPKFSANDTADFDIFVQNGLLEQSTSVRSVTRPGTAHSAVTVGAADSWDDSLEPFSSHGPTIDGRLKPEIVAPDNVSTSQPQSGLNPFYGTSAAAPHASGVAALLLEADSSLGPFDIKAVLTGTTGIDSPSRTAGYGLIDATEAVSAVGGNVEDSGPLAITQTHGATTSDGLNSTKEVSFVANKELAFDQGNNYHFLLTNEDTGDAATLAIDGSVTVPPEGFIGLNVRDGDGTALSDPLIYTQESGPLPLTVIDGEIPPAAGLTNFSVALLHPSNGSEMARTETAPSVVGYEGVLEQNSTAGTVELSVPRDVVPESTDVDLVISKGELHDGSERHTLPMTYDSEADTFTTVVDTTEFEAGNYSWETSFVWNGVQILQVRSPHSDNENITLETETATITGQVLDADGDAADNDTVAAFDRVTSGQLDPEDSRVSAVLTNETGHFTLEVPADGEYELGYYQGNFIDGVGIFPRDGSPDVHALTTATAEGDDVVLTEPFELGAAHDLNVSVVEESGDPVENARVAYAHTVDDPETATGIDFLTNTDGLARAPADGVSRDSPGLEVTGNVTIIVAPPEGDERFVEQVYVQNRTVESNGTVEVELEDRVTEVTGRVLDHNGDPLRNDTVVLWDRVASGQLDPDDELVTQTLTNETGHFTLDVIPEGQFELGYIQGDVENLENLIPRDGSPDMYALTSLDVTDTDVVIQDAFQLPTGHDLNVSVVDESGDPVENAGVLYVHTIDDPSTAVGIESLTNGDGLAEVPDPENVTRTVPGLEVVGNVTVVAAPPDSDRFVERFYTENVTVEQDDRVTIELEETASTENATAVEVVPSEPVSNPGGEVTFDIVVTDADGGVGSYGVEVALANTTVAAITDAADRTGAGTVEIVWGEENSSVTVNGFLSDTADTGRVTIASVTVESKTVGQSGVNVSIGDNGLGDESAIEYTVTALRNATLTVGAGPPSLDRFDDAPTDPDNDGVYEDVNGDGKIAGSDAVALFLAISNGDPVATGGEWTEAFDFNGDGAIRGSDAVQLFLDISDPDTDP